MNQELVSQLVISEIIFIHTGKVLYALLYYQCKYTYLNNTSTHYSAEYLCHVVVQVGTSWFKSVQC